MPSKVDDQISRSVMFLCIGTAFVLLVAQVGQQWGKSFAQFTPHPMGITRTARSSKTPPQNTGVKPSVKVNQASLAVANLTPTTNTKLVVHLGDRKVYIYKGSQLEKEYPLAVAQAGWETPTGAFQVLNMEKNPLWVHPITGEEVPPGPNNPLGVAWIGFWTDGESEIGFHGTNQEELIGEAVSHGCLRMRNADIEAIYAQVSQGTPVIVQP